MDPRILKTMKAYNEIAGAYAEENNSEKIVNNMIPLLDRFITYAGKGRYILDVGCGHGRDAKYFSEKGFNVTAIDLSKGLLAIAKKAAPKADFKVMDMTELDFPDSSFDGLWACASFLHVPKEFANDTLKGFYNVLMPEGLLFLCVKDGDSEGFVNSKAYGGCERYFSDYRLGELEPLLDASGFEMVETIADGKFINTYSRAKK
ncbi:MAG: class I SAM-dependent methyltransferase [Candidatus Omnitrophica bacterium]|nr:class I SAM-dependent methyltransferase [Candidatus Omnitrophota bacterium]